VVRAVKCFVGRGIPIGVREGILLGDGKKCSLKIIICPKNKKFFPETNFFSLFRIGPETS